MRLATGAFKNSPIDSLEVITESIAREYTTQVKLANYINWIKNHSNQLYSANYSKQPRCQQNPQEQPKRAFIPRRHKASTTYDSDINNILKENMQSNPLGLTGKTYLDLLRKTFQRIL